MKKLSFIGSVALVLLLLGCGGQDGANVGGQTSRLSAEELREMGITDTEVIFGTHTDLTGPIALFGEESMNGIRMRFNEINQEGGIHGRKLRIIVEDSSYDVTRSISAANKLLNRDKIFAMLLALGTPNNNAVLTQQIPKGVPNLFPLTGSNSMSDPFHKLKFTQRGNYYEEARYAVQLFVGERGLSTPCAMHVDNDFGIEVLQGTKDELETMGKELVHVTAHKATETEFTGALLSLRDAGCDVIFMGTVYRDTILIMTGIDNMDWRDVVLVGNNAGSARAIAASGVADGYYAFTHLAPIYLDQASTTAAERDWYKRWVTLYGTIPDGTAMEAYRGADIVAVALERAGRVLNREKFLAALESIDSYEDIFGNTLTFGPDDHVGVDQSKLVRVENGRWVEQEVIQITDDALQ